MAVTNCPHCKADVPPGFDAMPVCMMCGGDINAAPAEGSGWAAIDTKQDNTRVCPSCNSVVKSVFALECPECNASLTPVGEPVADIEKERERFEELITQSHAEAQPAAPAVPEPVAPAPEPVAPPIPEPVAPPVPEPVVAAPEPVAPPIPEPVAPAPEPVAPPIPEPVAAAKGPSPELPSFVDKPKTEEPAPTRPEPPKQPEPAPAKEGFFDKLLRMFGLKK
ncbi:MAG: hypothetical protein CVV27_05370 [Candidatus Melainabacteria bacterium HGW-Melainabacteria-1]|nr:MAG: hypothetical protein CVV27_05370 [Candidatus Melainabacteria bacterium HGW-Melainabacteria-1]